MPKIVIKVDRKTHTRSKTQEERRPGEEGPERSPVNRSLVTPSKSASKVDPRSTVTRIQKTGTRYADRRFFTVWEDNTILQHFKAFEGAKPSRLIADELSKKMNHTVESIRDRIKRFLSRIRPSDEAYIAEEAKVRFVLCKTESDFRPTQTTTFTSRRRVTSAAEL